MLLLKNICPLLNGFAGSAILSSEGGGAKKSPLSKNQPQSFGSWAQGLSGFNHAMRAEGIRAHLL